MNIALVGYTFSEMDQNILSDTYKELGLQKGNNLDFIDLSLGRDFLKEDKEYDVIVLIYIFLLSKEELNQDPLYKSYKKNERMMKGIEVSEFHTPENWRKRLLSSNAKEILIFGWDSRSEVTPEYIGELENYKLKAIEFKNRDDFIYGRLWRYSK